MQSFKITNQNAMYFLTLTAAGWIDLFTRKVYRDIFIESLAYCQREKGLEINAYVVMSNHVHLIASAKPPFQLSGVLRDLKKFTSVSFIRAIQELPESRREWLLLVMEYQARFNSNNSFYQFWQSGSHPIELYSPDFTLEKLVYLHQNPVRAGMVLEAEHYLYSSAGDYAGRPGLLEIVKIDLAPSIGYVHMGAPD